METFTQNDIERIVKERLSEEKKKYEADIAKRELELKQKEFQFEAKSMLKKNGFPDTLFDILKGDDVETFQKNVDTLKAYMDEKYKTETHIQGHDNGTRPGFMTRNNNIRRAMGL